MLIAICFPSGWNPAESDYEIDISPSLIGSFFSPEDFIQWVQETTPGGVKPSAEKTKDQKAAEEYRKRHPEVFAPYNKNNPYAGGE